MHYIDTTRKILLTLLAIPITLAVLETILKFLDAREQNAIVSFIYSASEWLVPDALETMLQNQQPWQTVIIGLLAYGMAAIVIYLLAAGARQIATNIAARRQATDNEG